MPRLILLLGATIATLCLSPSARADWDDRPGFDFHAQINPEAPCGVGTPPRGHFAREVSPTSLPQGLKLTVQQDAHRLCYVTGNLAEAPTLRVRQGTDFSITLRNEITDPAAIANFVAIGQLDEPNEAVPAEDGFYPVVPGMRHAATGITNLHLHGFAVPPTVPQDEVLNTCTDPAVGPAICGHREVTYRYHVPANMPAGLYWYHPHIHGEVHAQMLMGLSGAIVVEGPDDDARRAVGIQDRIFVIRQSQDLDVKTPSPDAAAAAPAMPAAHAAPAPQPPVAHGTGETIDTAHEIACSDNTGLDEITLNGSKILDNPASDDDLAHIQIAAGTTQLWRILNAANDAFLDLALIDENGTALPVTIVARDGAPLTDDAGNRLPAVPTAASQFVSPSGRLEFMIAAPPVGKKVYFVTHAVDTGCTGDKVPERRLALVTAVPTATAAIASAAPAAALTPAAPDLFSGLIARKTDRERIIAMAEYPRPGADDQSDFYIMERKPGGELRTYAMGGPPIFTVKAGTVEEWVVENWTSELHAFHVHQVHFRVLEINGKPAPDHPLLDVVNVPYATPAEGDRPAVPGRVRIKLEFPEELAGDIPFHCHLVDHEDNGMMAVLRVLPAKLGLLDPPAAGSGSNWWEHPPICTPAKSAGLDRTPQPPSQAAPDRG
jgi:FtsP/CotA-like multicopper oxidase with cupredoxin domain